MLRLNTKYDLAEVVTVVYFVGVFLCWATLIAYAVDGGKANDMAFSVALGWVAAIFWPLIVTVQAILFIFF